MEGTAMGSHHSRQRGEGKIGCILSLLVFAAGIAAGIKIVPVYYSNNTLQEFAADLAGQAGFKPRPQLETELRNKAELLGIPEALDKGGMTVTIIGDPSLGTCTIALDYTRVVDLYGVYTLPIRTHKSIARTYRDMR
jgi:hypothetical protein